MNNIMWARERWWQRYRGKEGEEERRGGGWITSCQERLAGETIVKGGSAGPSQMDASHKKHRPHINVGKDAEEEEHFCETTRRVVLLLDSST